MTTDGSKAKKVIITLEDPLLSDGTLRILVLTLPLIMTRTPLQVCLFLYFEEVETAVVTW